MNIDKFDIYLKELTEWNKKINLTSIIAEDEIRTKHFEDSKTLIKAYDFSIGNPKVIDVGTGAGFPGIPINSLFPNIRLTLIDSVKKKIEFLKHVVQALGLFNVNVLWGRAEDLAKNTDLRENFDVAVSRALGHLSVDCELCLPFVKPGGVFISMKSKNQGEEIKEAESAINKLGGKIKEVVDVVIPGTDIERKLVVIEKVSPTPLKYPRKPGMPKRKPLQKKYPPAKIDTSSSSSGEI